MSPFGSEAGRPSRLATLNGPAPFPSWKCSRLFIGDRKCRSSAAFVSWFPSHRVGTLGRLLRPETVIALSQH
jgi:hypothetical protein